MNHKISMCCCVSPSTLQSHSPAFQLCTWHCAAGNDATLTVQNATVHFSPSALKKKWKKKNDSGEWEVRGLLSVIWEHSEIVWLNNN